MIRDLSVCLSVCMLPFFSEVAKRIFVKLLEVHQLVLRNVLGKKPFWDFWIKNSWKCFGFFFLITLLCLPYSLVVSGSVLDPPRKKNRIKKKNSSKCQQDLNSTGQCQVSLRVINKATDNVNVCDIMGWMDDTGIRAIIVACSVNDGIFVQNEHARQDSSL